MRMRQRFYTGFQRLAVLVAAAVLLWMQARAVLMFVQHDWIAVRFPYPLDYGEGPLLDQTVRLGHFENIYRVDLTVPPYTVANYPPLFLLAQVPWLWAFGPAFCYGRAISTLSILAAALFIGLTLHALTRDWLAAAMGGLTLLAFPYILHWSAFNRVDSLALGLSCAGLLVIARWPDRRGGLVGSALLLPALNALTRGGFFFNIVTANVNPFEWDEVTRRKDEIVEHMLYLLIGSGLFLAGAVWARVGSWWLIAPYLAGAAAAALTIGKAGSNVNYLLELMAAFSLVAGALIAWTAKWRWLRALVLLLLAAQLATLTAWSREEYYQRVVGKVA